MRALPKLTFCDLVRITITMSLCLILTNSSWAQDRRPQGKGERPKIGVIRGQIQDSETNVPVEYATVAVHQKKDSAIVAGTVSDKHGKFMLSELPLGKYFVKVDFLGYKPQTFENIRLTPKGSIEHDIGMVKLELDLTMLKSAEVVEERQQMELLMDRKVFHVDNNLNNAGSSASEVLENIPSVEVDIDGNVSLRGSANVNILIDGKPSSLTGASRDAILDQIPADAIERVELITNPSAKFDPDGTAGIINIITKKNKLEGFQSNVNMSVSTGMQHSLSIGLSKKTAKLNLYSNYSYRYSDMYHESLTLRNTYFGDSTVFQDQYSYGTRIRQTHSIKLGTDYYINPKNTISLSGKINPRVGTRGDSLVSLLQWEGQDLEHFQRDNTNASNSFGYDITLGYVKEFESRDHNLKADVSFSQFKGVNENLYLQNHYDQDLSFILDSALTETQDSDDGMTTYLGQLDYTRLFPNKTTQIEAGWKSTLRTMDNDLVVQLSNDAGDLENDPNRSNHFVYQEDVHAVYAVLGQKIKRFSFSAGLRAEQAFTQSDQLTTSETFENDYFRLYPSGHVNYALGEKNQVQASYSRRVNRPRTRQLNPFPNFSNPLSVRMGNPNLLPEFINSYELTWINTQRTGSTTGSVYYKQISNVIGRFSRLDSLGVTRSTYENLTSARNLGIEVITAGKLAKWWSYNLSANFYRTINDGSNIEGELNAAGWSWNARLNSIWKWGEGWNVQYSAFYRGPYIGLQGRSEPIYGMDLAFKKSIFKNRGSIGLRLRDIFDTREFNFNSDTRTFDADSYRKRESRNLYLTFTYNFGKLERGRDRKNRGNREDSGGGGFDMDDF